MTPDVASRVSAARKLERAGHRSMQADARQPSHVLVLWIVLVGIFLPQMVIPLGGVNLTPGRFIVILFLVPSLYVVLQGKRSWVASDLFVVLLMAWMLLSSALNGGFRPYVGAEALELLGAYMAGRAFVFGSAGLRKLVDALKRITLVLVGFALLDTVSGRNVTAESLELAARTIGQENYRMGLVRADSVFPNPEHYGTFCVAALSIFLYSEHGMSRVCYVGLTLFGAALSLSSGPLMGLGIVMAVFSYDRMLKQYRWRWKVLISMVVGFVGAIFIVLDNPVQWILVHATIDPQTGFFRLGTWDAVLPLIDQSPFVGHGLITPGVSQSVYLASIDCLWLVEALRYGVPGLILLLFTMFSPLLPSKQSGAESAACTGRTGFSLAIVVIGIIGLTVHFWDATWLFLSFCIGVRASIAAYDRQRRISHKLWHGRAGAFGH